MTEIGGITIRRATVADGVELNIDMMAGWTTAPYGPVAWEFWHKESFLNPETDYGFVAVDNETGKIVGSCISRFRDQDFRPEHLRRELSLTLAQKEAVGWDLYSAEEQETILKFWEVYGICYEAGAIDVQQYLPVGRPYLYVRQMRVREEFRERGIGGVLLGEVLAEARKRNCAVQLESWGKGRQFYAKYGSNDAGPVYPLSFEHKREAAQSCMLWYV
ncbi:hypothetical protein HK100_003912 [Physocladia obscura]|uniref:N-acetyltransferase domain-containing protein n=1 Tax=Physocladia obscura TaxID=109957 RepID=A0AAD5T7A3_9FUNG|nr:hypothetical protein HK100_003912 [Physocladia obscura]